MFNGGAPVLYCAGCCTCHFFCSLLFPGVGDAHPCKILPRKACTRMQIPQALSHIAALSLNASYCGSIDRCVAELNAIICDIMAVICVLLCFCIVSLVCNGKLLYTCFGIYAYMREVAEVRYPILNYAS